MKSDCSLFSCLFIACQIRNGDFDEFFKHENQACPPSIAEDGHLRLPRQKSNVASSLHLLTTQQEAPANSEVIVMDGAALVNMIKPSVEDKTFAEYASNTFAPYVSAQLQHVKCIDIVWDDYVEASLKATTRHKRGQGVRQRVAPGNKLARNWKEFLRDGCNKQELFRLLAQCVASIHSGEKQVVSSHGQGVLSTLPLEDVSRLAPRTQEEADTRMFLHVADAVKSGFVRIVVRSVDTDVLVLTVTLVQEQTQESIQLWVAFGTGTNLRYVPAHEIASSLGENNALALPAFQVFSVLLLWEVQEDSTQNLEQFPSDYTYFHRLVQLPNIDK